MQTFVVERYVPGAGPDRLAAIAERLSAASLGPSVLYRGSIVVAADEACLCLFDADGPDAVRSANEALDLPISRIVLVSCFPPEDALVTGF
jgi:hypothetical protein